MNRDKLVMDRRTDRQTEIVNPWASFGEPKRSQRPTNIILLLARLPIPLWVSLSGHLVNHTIRQNSSNADTDTFKDNIYHLFFICKVKGLPVTRTQRTDSGVDKKELRSRKILTAA